MILNEATKLLRVVLISTVVIQLYHKIEKGWLVGNGGAVSDGKHATWSRLKILGEDFRVRRDAKLLQFSVHLVFIFTCASL